MAQDFEKIYLGKLKQDIDVTGSGESVYLSKHKWDCGWYWGFGYLGNKNCHFHFDSLLYATDSKRNTLFLASELFESTNITDSQWWIMRDLMVQAYALKKAAEVYRYGGHQSSREGITDILRNPDMAKTLNNDLERILDKLWDFACKAVDK